MARSSLLLADEEKAKQGTHELEISFGGELDLHKHFSSCSKNPGHVDFIPITSLNCSHLLKHFSQDILVPREFCSLAAKLTVKLKVRYVSLERAGRKNYPLSGKAGQRVLSVGSGCVTEIDLKGNNGAFPCPLENCPHSAEPHQANGYIIITTAAHTIFDSTEAKETVVEFFYDNATNKSSVEIAHGVKVRDVCIVGDFCELMCVTHSPSLIHKASQLHLDHTQFSTLSSPVTDLITPFLTVLACLNIIFTSTSETDIPPFVLDIHEYIKINLEKDIKHMSSGILTASQRDTEILVDFLRAAELVSGQTGLKDTMLSLLSKCETSCGFVSLTHVLNKGELSDAIIAHIVFMGAACFTRRFGLKSINLYRLLFTKHADSLAREAASIARKQQYPNQLFQHPLPSAQNQGCPTSSHVFTSSPELIFRDKVPQALQIGKLILEFDHIVAHSATMPVNVNDVSVTPSDRVIFSQIRSTENDHLLIHISHPHGQSKHVTFGTHFSCKTENGYYEHIYTVPTCNGCSGGPVWILPLGEDGKVQWDQVYGVPHGGCYDRGNKLNHSCSWTFYPSFPKQESTQSVISAIDLVPVEKHVKLLPDVDGRRTDRPPDNITTWTSYTSHPQTSYGSASRFIPMKTIFTLISSREDRAWLLYLIRTSDTEKFPDDVSIISAINKKKRLGKNERISDNDDIEALLARACMYKW